MHLARPPIHILPESLRPSAQQWTEHLTRNIAAMCRQIPLQQLRGEPISHLLPRPDPLISALTAEAEYQVSLFMTCSLIGWLRDQSPEVQSEIRRGLTTLNAESDIDLSSELQALITPPDWAPLTPDAATLRSVVDTHGWNAPLMRDLWILWPAQRQDSDPVSFWTAVCQATEPTCAQLWNLDPRWHSGPERPWLPRHLRHDRPPGQLWLQWAGTNAPAFFGTHT